MKRLQKHIKEVHPNDVVADENDDGVLNYSKTALALCLLSKNFVDARKHGDGERITRLYKFMLLYYKVDGRTKYSFQTLHYLAQINFLLPPSLSHELKWNRFVNTKGKIDSNVELDRHLEHRNKAVKADLAQYQGKITETSIARVSRSYHRIQEIMDIMDKELTVEKPSGQHTQIDPKEDILKLSEQFNAANLFCQIPGRYHTRFPGFPKSYPSKIDVLALKKWIYKKLDDFHDLNIYQCDKIFT